MTDELKGPVNFEIKRFIKDKIWVEFYCINDKTFKGQIIWVDQDAFHIHIENGNEITLLKHAIIYYNKAQF